MCYHIHMIKLQNPKHKGCKRKYQSSPKRRRPHLLLYSYQYSSTCCEQKHSQQKKKERQRKMAMKNCFQVSSVYSTRAGVVQCYQPFSSVKKIHLPISNGLNKSNFSFTSSCSSLSLPLGSRSRNSLILCKAREAVNEGLLISPSWQPFSQVKVFFNICFCCMQFKWWQIQVGKTLWYQVKTRCLWSFGHLGADHAGW